MNKLLGWIVILLCAWVFKLSLDVYSLRNQQVQALNQRLEQQNQRVAMLNDQMVALQQQQTNLINQHNTKPSQLPTISPSYLVLTDQYQQQNILDRLLLIQANLQQQYLTTALEQIQRLRQKLTQEQPLPESLNLSLIAALLRDQNVITVYMQQRNEQQFILQKQLYDIEQKLQPVDLDNKVNKWRWSSWLSIGRAENSPNLQNRAFQYKELQLQLLLAQHALNRGQNTFYLAQIKQIIASLAIYPDQHSQEIVQQLKKLQGIALTPAPQLSALALMQDERGRE